ncbi:dTMP kinase [Noviherbaspirillum sp.]|uniref:dTMP kinase n=1 Tax=Noviherbaspirillum sp. TaxID=1926288 RepID=UPI002D4FF615|nr:dTMP kinase [Noviherbaspirillum sp.]HZW22648.1 dTMP kinase [Noviherbaspirillum sp.]
MAFGRFISFEGIDGAGKSTHLDFVASLLKKSGKRVVVTREPGGTPLGEKLRSLVLNEEMNIETEALLMFASRCEHIEQVIAPALVRGEWVISDRFTDATFAYQGGGRRMSIEKLKTLERCLHPHIKPNLTLLFDVPLEVARARLDATRELDKFEREQSEFFAGVRKEYLRRAAEEPDRIHVIDSSRPIGDIQREIEQIISAI